MLAWLRALQEPPWPQASAAMADELRAIGLGKLAGPNGAGLSAAIQEEVERLMVIADRRQHGGMDDAAAPLPTPAR